MNKLYKKEGGNYRFFVKCWGDPLIHLVEEHFIGVFLFFFGLLSIHK